MRWWRRYLEWRKRDPGLVVATPSGFRFERGRWTREVRWTAITRITAYKRDLLTTDLLCLLIEADGAASEVNEEVPGFDVIDDALESELGVAPDWKRGVVFPAFHPNPAVIFPRDPVTA